MSEFLSRWSRRKRGEAAEPEAEAPPLRPEALPVPLADPAAAPVAEAEPVFDLSLLPSLEELTAETDIRGFLHKAVPAGLRNAALKRMWALDPAIRDFVGPVDYAWDFNDPAGLPGISEALTGDVTDMLARAIGIAPQQDLAAADSVPALPPEISLAPEPLPAPEEPPPEPLRLANETPPPRRRHGGARPV